MVNIEYIKQYCCDDIRLIENYDKALNDNTQNYDCHHRREISECKTAAQLKAENLYYNCPADELILLTHGEHSRLHLLGKRYDNWRRTKFHYVS